MIIAETEVLLDSENHIGLRGSVNTSWTELYLEERGNKPDITGSGNSWTKAVCISS